jgi:hypothetical protein
MRLNGISIELHGKIQRIEQFAKIVATKTEMHVFIKERLGERERNLREKYAAASELLTKLIKDKIEMPKEVEKMGDYLTLKTKVSTDLIAITGLKDLPNMKSSLQLANEHKTITGNSEAKDLLKKKIAFYETFLDFIKAANDENNLFFAHLYWRCHRYLNADIEVNFYEGQIVWTMHYLTNSPMVRTIDQHFFFGEAVMEISSLLLSLNCTNISSNFIIFKNRFILQKKII